MMPDTIRLSSSSKLEKCILDNRKENYYYLMWMRLLNYGREHYDFGKKKWQYSD